MKSLILSRQTRQRRFARLCFTKFEWIYLSQAERLFADSITSKYVIHAQTVVMYFLVLKLELMRELRVARLFLLDFEEDKRQKIGGAVGEKALQEILLQPKCHFDDFRIVVCSSEFMLDNRSRQ
jgi:hypothetical protein